MSDSIDFTPLLRAVRGRSGLAALVRSLGFTVRPGRGVPVDAGRGASDDGEGATAVTCIGERPGARVLLLEQAEPLDASRVGRLARRLREADLATHNLLIAVGRDRTRVLIACVGLEGELRHLVIEPAAVLASDAETLAEMAAPPGEAGLVVALRHMRALDRTRVTDRFFEAFRAMRARVAAAWTGLPADAVAEREELALLLLCRLMFLYFLQRAGRLGGDRAYLAGRLAEHRSAGRTGFYRCVLKPLFFGALNRRPERRSAEAMALGPLPYLNGGLFERIAAERRHGRLDLPDEAAAAVFDELLERYRFAPRESGEDRIDRLSAVAVDPEMLGRVFERIMDPARRGRTGTYFTPAVLVDALVAEALAAHLSARLAIPAGVAERVVAGESAAVPAATLRLVGDAVLRLRVLDPACGSGAFLLGALSRLVRLAPAADAAAARRHVVARGLHGVDVQGDAALLCSLRLWLALALDGGEPVPPLPNLDRRIRQGDALLDPLELAGAAYDAPAERGAAGDPAVRVALRALPPLALRYVSAEPAERPAIQRRVVESERALARAWARALSRRLTRAIREAKAAAAAVDLWGRPTERARLARAELRSLRRSARELRGLMRRLARDGELPFFSFRVHFAEPERAGFDLVLSNPPWVRAHRWPGALRRVARGRFAVCRHAGWPAGAGLAGAPAAAGAQVDLSQLFLEKSVALLAPAGTVGAVVPAKTFRSLYGGGARALLLRETRIHAIDDHALDHRGLFTADAFAATVVATRLPAADHVVRVRLRGRAREPLCCDAPQDALPLFPGDERSPWLFAPDGARRALRRMQAAGQPLGRHPGLRVRRGVFTGANEVLLVTHAAPRLGGLVDVRAAGRDASSRRAASGPSPNGAADYEALVEASALRPLLRGSGIGPWRHRTGGWIIWLHDAMGRPVPAPRHTARYLERHRGRLDRRDGAQGGRRGGSVFRAGPWTCGPKVAWQDLAADLEVVFVPGAASDGLGSAAPVVPLNTVYFLPVGEDATGHVLAAILNSLPLRTFARAIAERAKDARFRFFAWTVSCLPLPGDWRADPAAAELRGLSEAAHAAGRIDDAARDRLDGVVARLYGLSPADLAALAAFDAWLGGRPGEALT